MAASQSNPYDIFSPHRHNHKLYEQMRREDPVHAAIDPKSGNTFWFLTRYDDCLDFLKDKRFGKQFRHRLPSQLADRWQLSNIDSSINQHMLNLDEPAHSRLKSLVHLAFTPLRISDLRPRLQNIADRLFDVIDTKFIDGQDYDLATEYIGKLAMMSLIEVLGLPQSDYDRLTHWVEIILGTEEISVNLALLEFTQYLSSAIELRQENSAKYHDLLSALVFVEDAGDKLNREELLAMVYLIFTAGYETMLTFLSYGFASLRNNPKQLQDLRKGINQTEVLKSSIEEMLRYHGAVHITLASWAYEDVIIRNKLIYQGDVVHAVLQAANRDPSVFENPHEFNILRSPNKHIAFSYGIHHCLGAALARLEGEIAIETLLRRIPYF